MEEDQVPWPIKGEQLFKPDTGERSNACLNFTCDQFNLYATGYKRAGDLLVEHVERTNSNQDILIYPIAFLYRQYLELQLKEIIIKGNILLGIPGSYPKDHRLNILWVRCRRIIECLKDCDSVREEIEATEDYIHQFSKVDPYSMAFRYPTDKENKSSLPDMHHIGITNLKKVISGISSFLDATGMIISVELDFKWQAEEITEEFNRIAEAEFRAFCNDVDFYDNCDDRFQD